MLAASAAFLSFTVQAQTFQAVPLDGGGHTSGFVQADNGRIYAYGDVFGAWRTDNGGLNWNYLNWGIPDNGEIVGMGMAVQKDNADVVYYCTNTTLLKSTNGGTSWTRLFGDIEWGGEPSHLQRYRGASQILIRSNNPNEIWFAGPRKNRTGWLWKSSNGGTDWVKAGGSTFDNNKAITLHNISAYANQIWVGCNTGLFVSTDGGSNFVQVNTHPSVGMIQRFAAGPYAGVGLITRGSVDDDGGGISRITASNFGNTGTYTTTKSATVNLYFGYPTGLQVFSDNTVCAWNTGADRQGYSTDGGVTFTVRPTTLNTTHVPVWTTAAIMTAKNHPDYGTDQVIQVGNDPNKWIITGGGAAMQSVDKGLSWSYFPNGSGIAAVKTYTVALSRHDANRVYIPAGDIGSAIVTDGSTSGTAERSSTKTNQYLHSTFRVLEGPNANNLVLAGVSQNEDMTLLLKSNDGGVSWTRSSTTGNGLPVSRDGVTKSVMSLNDANDFLVVLASESGQQGASPPGSLNPGVWRTTNGGTSFTQVQNLPTTGLMTGHRYDPTQCFIDRDATLANVRYFASRTRPLHKSTNGGTNWAPIADPFPMPDGTYASTNSFLADPVRSDNLWAAGNWAGLRVSRNGGQDWQRPAQYFDAEFVSSCDGKIAVWGRKDGEPNPKLLWYSADDGATWTAQTTPEKNFHGVQGITVDRNGKIWVSWNSCTVVTPVTSTVADTQAPSVPSGLNATSVAQTSFTLNWTASTDNVGVTAYEVFRNGTSLGTTTATSYNVTGLTANTTHSMTVRARDAAGNNSAQTTALSVTTLNAPAGGSGDVVQEIWNNVSGLLVTDIPTGTPATSTAVLTSLEIPSNSADQYGVRIRGYIIPTATGDYTFYIASDDNGELRMSNNDQPVTTRIAYHTDWTNSRQWDRVGTQQSTPRSLEAGQKYYFEALMKEGGGGDNLAVGWTGPGISTITVIGAANLDRYIAPASTDTQAPSVPSGLNATSVAQTSFTLNWTASTDNVGVTAYEVFRNGTSLGTTTATSYNVTGLTANTTHSMTVRARDAAGNNSAQTTALSVTTLNASAGPSTGTGYTWRNLASATSNSNRTAAIGVNDDNLATDVVLPDNSSANQWQAAGMTWSSAKANITRIEYYNGSQLDDGSDNGCFTANIRVQHTTNGTTWVNTTGWTVSPAYPYNTSASNQTYTFTGPALPSTCLGVRIAGQVRTNDISWAIKVKEIRVFASTNLQQPLRVGTEPNQAVLKATLYPNPVTGGTLHIVFAEDEKAEGSVLITDLSGKAVLAGRLRQSNGQAQVDVGRLASGMYLVHTRSNEGTQVNKIVVAPQ